MDYKIISSGSSGNCVVIDDVMIDCGVPFNKIKDELYAIKYLLITHVHSDHLNHITFKQILRKFPTIKIIGNYEVHQAAHCTIIANSGFDIVTNDYVFTPFEALHDVLTYGFVWQNREGERIIYCTDTSTLENAPDLQYDYFFIESNHDEAKLEAARNEAKGGYNPFLSGKRHLSTQAAKGYFYMHRRSPESVLVELHKSKRFY